MVSLHKIIELFKLDELFDNSLFPDSLAVAKRELLNNYLKINCFDMGDYDLIPSQKGLLEAPHNLPFNHCWFEYIGQKNGKMGFFVYQPDPTCLVDGLERKAIFSFIFNKSVNENWQYLGFRAYISHGGIQKFYPSESGIGFFYIINNFLLALSCNNVKKIENVPPEKLQKKRIKNRKIPFFSYWTLHLKLSKEEQRKIGSNGGSHASPRLHLRRGHARQYQPGLFTWVQSCVVGNKENGLIMKDYAVKQKGDCLIP